MDSYYNLDGDSNVQGYTIGSDYIDVKFFGTIQTYRYSYRKAGAYHVEQLKRLAREGRGLGGYIQRYVRNLYD